MLAWALTVAGPWLPGLHFLGEAPGTENSGVMHSDDGLERGALGVRSVSLFSELCMAVSLLHFMPG